MNGFSKNVLERRDSASENLNIFAASDSLPLELCEIPILANSGNGNNGIDLFLNVNKLGSGLIEYIPKPIESDELSSLIKAIFKNTKTATLKA